MKKPKTIAQARTMYEGLPDNVRQQLQHEFDKVYDNAGDRERKFYGWLVKNPITKN